MRILGISPFHDSSVALIVDGKIEAFIKEERITRAKRDAHPFLAVERIMKLAKGPVDAAVLCSPDHTDNSLFAWESFLKKKYNIKKVYDLSDRHHLQHASLAFYNSGFNKALVFVIDRMGSVISGVGREAETVFTAEYPCNFSEIYKNIWLTKNGKNFTDNKDGCFIDATSNFGVVKVYETATSAIGQHALENGKTMGLAAYGRPNPHYQQLFKVRNLANGGLFDHEHMFGDDQAIFLELKDKKTDQVTEENFQLYADHAFQVQIQTQEAVCKMIDIAVKQTNIKKVCITGGYGLNVVANHYYTVRFPDIEFYFEPLADDSGNSIGGAMFVYRDQTEDSTVMPLETTFFHGEKYDLSGIEGDTVSISDVSKLLLNNKSVAVFNDIAEAGPRALGNRSILFNPCNANSKELINRVKNREWYRPFAAVVLEEDASEFFDMKKIDKSPFMTMSFFVNPTKKDLIPGVVHVDNSCRIQTVSSKDGYLYDLLTEFKKVSGVGVLLNTSFNLAGEALVDSPIDAIDVFDRSNLDYLWFPEVSKIKTKN